MTIFLAGLACGVLAALAAFFLLKRRGSASSAAAAGGAKSGTVLLVDDDEAVIGVARRMLQDRGYRVLCAQSAEEAQAISETEPGEILLLLTDINLPKKTGRQLAEAVSARRPAIKVLFMSGFTDVPALQQKVSEEHVPFLQKPFTPDTLLSSVAKTLEA